MSSDPSDPAKVEPSTGDRRPIASRDTRWAASIARRLASTGISANQISVAGMVFAVGAGFALAFAEPTQVSGRLLLVIAAVLAFLRLLANMFDGMVAVEHGQATPIGELFNEIPDRVSDSAVFVGAGFLPGATPELGLAAACVSLFVAYARAAARVAGAPSDFRGPMAKQQRMAVMIVVCLFIAATPSSWSIDWGPDSSWGWMAIALWVVIAGGTLTAMLRLFRAGRYLAREG